jgi:hypothetical protein
MLRVLVANSFGPPGGSGGPLLDVVLDGLLRGRTRSGALRLQGRRAGRSAPPWCSRSSYSSASVGSSPSTQRTARTVPPSRISSTATQNGSSGTPRSRHPSKPDDSESDDSEKE